MTDPNSAARTYQLLIEVAAPIRVRVGRLGSFDFPAGRYVYTGSALRNFEARVARHRSTAKKKVHWHIDYLLAAPGVRVRDVLRHAQAECAINQQLIGAIVVEGFGASDCRSGCGRHLKRVADWPLKAGGAGGSAPDSAPDSILVELVVDLRGPVERRKL